MGRLSIFEDPEWYVEICEDPRPKFIIITKYVGIMISNFDGEEWM